MYLDLAISVARRSTCRRAKVGAVLVNNNRIIGTGYNGSARGYRHCIQRDKCWTTTGSHGKCRACVHAEVNAILNAAQGGIPENKNLALYVTLRPCLECMKIALALGVKEITYLIHREDRDSDNFEVYLDEELDYNAISIPSMKVKKAYATVEQAAKCKLYSLSTKQ